MKLDSIISEIKSLDRLSQLEKEKLVKFSSDIGEELVKKRLKTNQIRKFWSAINKINSKIKTESYENIKDEIVMLKPKLAYAAGRKTEVIHLMKVLDPCIEKISDIEDFEVFTKFVESIVAYHKYHGSK